MPCGAAAARTRRAYDWLLKTLSRAAEITFANGSAQVTQHG